MRRSTLAVLLAAGTTAGALTVPATPAAAAQPSVVLVSATSGYNSTVAKSAVAQCPDDYPYVYSAGGEITDSGGLVTLTDAHARADMRSVIAWGHENGGYAGSWSVSAYATCGTSAVVQRVVTGTQADGDPDKSVEAKCPTDTALYGVGWEMNGAAGAALPAAVRPNGLLTRLTVEAHASNGFAGDWALVAHAVCGPRVPGMTLVTTVSAVDYVAPRSQPAGACPDGGDRYGIGGEVGGSATDGYLAVSRIGSVEPGTTGETLGWWWYWLFQVVTYAICAP